MSKIVKSKPMAEFLSKFGKFQTYTTHTAIKILCSIIDKVGKGYFERTDVELSNNIDKQLKSTFKTEIEMFCNEQAEACRDEILSLPSEIWMGESTVKANVGVFVFTQNADASIVTVKMGTQFSTVRQVFMFIAQRDGRLAAWDLFHQEDVVDLYNKSLDEMRETQGGNGDGGGNKQDDKQDSSNPENVIDATDVSPELRTSLRRLTAACTSVELSKGQSEAIVSMIDDVAEHVESLKPELEGEKDTPPVLTKPENVQNVATG